MDVYEVEVVFTVRAGSLDDAEELVGRLLDVADEPDALGVDVSGVRRMRRTLVHDGGELCD